MILSIRQNIKLVNKICILIVTFTMDMVCHTPLAMYKTEIFILLKHV